MKKYYALLTMLFLFTGVMWGQILQWNTFGNTGTETTEPSVYNNPNIAAADLTQGNITAASNGNRFGGSGWFNTGDTGTGNTLSEAIAGGDYIQFVVTPNSGYSFTPTSLDFSWQSSSTGPKNVTLRSSIDNYTSNIGTSAVTSSIASYSISISGITGITTATTFRLYGYGATATSGTGGFDVASNIVNVQLSGSVSSLSSPSISINPSSLSGFSYIEGSGPSTSQSYELSGSNLDPAEDELTVTGSTNFEVSLDDETFSSSVNVPYTGGELSATNVYVRLKSGLSAGNYNSETISNEGGGATTQDVTVSGTVYKVEPTNHATSFASAAGTPDHSSIDISWTDATGGTAPDGYLIKASTTSFAAIVDPVDGTTESNGTLVKNVLGGVQTATFSSLSPSTTYFFKIYPYTNSSTNINYKTDGSVPTTSLATDAPPPASLLLEENFAYAADALLTDNGWTAHSSGGTAAITVNNGGLTFTDYASVSGNAALVDNTGEDVNKTFTEVSSGAVYVSFLVKVDAIAAGYFFNIGPSTISTTFRGRVFIQDNGGNLQFGLSKGSNTGTFSSNNYSTGTTYLLVLKYEIVDGASNDVVSLFVFEDLDDFSTEPETPTIGPLTDGAITDINPGSVALRQYSSLQNVVVDGIRISEAWTLAPLPVELTSFTATAKGRGVELVWNTATEVNNYGFEIEKGRMKDELGSMNWEKIGFVEGHGTTNAPKSYTFVDGSASGTVAYRLKQIDRDGSFEYSNQVEITIAAPKEFALMQNHPNPFNPATAISYTLPVAGHVTLKIYNLIGKEVATLVNGVQDAGVKVAQFNASQLPSGIYFYTLRTQNFSATRKMMLLK
jgi:hypothetical protein